MSCPLHSHARLKRVNNLHAQTSGIRFTLSKSSFWCRILSLWGVHQVCKCPGTFHVVKCKLTTCLVVLLLCHHTSPAVSTRAGWGSPVSTSFVSGWNVLSQVIFYIWSICLLVWRSLSGICLLWLFCLSTVSILGPLRLYQYIVKGTLIFFFFFSIPVCTYTVSYSLYNRSY